MSWPSNGAPLPERETYVSHNDAKNAGSIAVTALLSIYVIYQIVTFYDLPTKSLPGLPFFLAWDLVVLFTPARILAILDNEFQNGSSVGDHRPASTHALKAESLQRIILHRKPSLLNNNQITLPLKVLRTALKSESRLAPPGLGNWDNSCYQNSVIQGLATLPSLRKFLENNVDAHRVLSLDTTNGALLDMIRKLNAPSKQGSYIWTTRKLKSMSSFQQQDAQEYYSKVLDEIEREIKDALKLGVRDPGLTDLGTDPKDASKGEEVENSSQNSAGSSQDLTDRPSPNPLDGLLAQRVGCTQCGHSEGISLIPFNCLTVSLGQSWVYDLRSCLDDFTRLEVINGVDCAKCTLDKRKADLHQFLLDQCPDGAATSSKLRDAVSERLRLIESALEEEDFEDDTIVKKCQIPKKSWVSGDKSKQAVIARAPESLVIHVNRSVFDELTGQLQKNYADVRFEPILDLAPWCLGSQNPLDHSGEVEVWPMTPTQSILPGLGNDSRNSLPYKLTALITHYGRHENGHYVCYRKLTRDGSNKDPTSNSDSLNVETWWRISDHQAISVTESDVLQQGGVFMLFYEKTDKMSPGPPKLIDGDVQSTKAPEVSQPQPSPLNDKAIDDDGGKTSPGLQATGVNMNDSLSHSILKEQSYISEHYMEGETRLAQAI